MTIEEKAEKYDLLMAALKDEAIPPKGVKPGEVYQDAKTKIMIIQNIDGNYAELILDGNHAFNFLAFRHNSPEGISEGLSRNGFKLIGQFQPDSEPVFEQPKQPTKETKP